ncbi:MAG: SufB/SufD family protein [Candidatus Micrarchaeia archaeon]
MKYLEIAKKAKKELEKLAEEPNPLYARNSLSMEMKSEAAEQSMLSALASEIGDLDLITNGEYTKKNGNVEAKEIDSEIDYNFLFGNESKYVAYVRANTSKLIFLKADAGERKKVRLLIGGNVQVISILEERANLEVEEFVVGRSVGIINEINASKSSNAKINIAYLSDNALGFYKGVCGEDSQIEVNSFIGGNLKSSNNLVCNGAKSMASINNIIIGSGNKIDIANSIISKAPSSLSSMKTKAIGAGASTILIKDHSLIERGARGADAYISARGISLGNSRIEALPSMTTNEIDVKASHNASIAPLKKEAIEYFMSRGISEKQAKKLLLKGFVEDMLVNFSSEELIRNKVEKTFENILG